jgi:arabinose-5-phosphate isomerase
MRAVPLKAVEPDPSHVSGDLAVAQRVLGAADEAIKLLGKSLGPDFSRAVDTLLAVKERVIVSGIGKSGHIARKIAATLASTGTPAHFVHPSEASHGDLGELTRHDAVLMLSWGGESDELSDMINYAKRFRIPLIGMGWNPESTLLMAADVTLVLPKIREACPHGLAPTTSATLQLVMGDALAMALMERRDFTADQYHNLHPGGALGRALIRVRDLMHGAGEMPLADENASLHEAVAAMEKHNFGCIGVIDKRGCLAGIITDGDLRRHLDRDLRQAKASDVMTRNPKTVRADQLAVEAVALMNEKQITQLFVLDPKAKLPKPAGILHIHDCLRAGLR